VVIKIEEKILTGTVDLFKSDNVSFSVKWFFFSLVLAPLTNYGISLLRVFLHCVDNPSVSQSDRAISLLSLENTKSVKIRFQDPEHFGSMVWSGDDDLQLHLGESTAILHYDTPPPPSSLLVVC
jgi:hypothetical protein